jgi:hypothetical protein
MSPYWYFSTPKSVVIQNLRTYMCTHSPKANFTLIRLDSLSSEDTGRGMDNQSLISDTDSYFCLFDTESRPAVEPTQPPIEWVPRFVSLEIERTEREADHSSISTGDYKNAQSN